MSKLKKSKVSSRYVPYASGFNPPSKNRQVNAVGMGGQLPSEYSIFKDASGFEFFKPVPKPTSIEDWLAQYKEDGQTYRQFMSECPWLSARKRKSVKQAFVPKGKTILEKYPDGKIYLVPVGEFNGHQINFDELARFAEVYLGIPVCSLPGIKIEVQSKNKKVILVDDPILANGTDGKNRRKSSRVKQQTLESRFNGSDYQLGVGDMLHVLRNKLPDNAICFIGLTMSDLFCDDTDLFVAGMAAGNHRVAIFSFYRYNPALSFSHEYWYKIFNDKTLKTKEIQKLMFQRSCKLLVHEICHLLGIDHCIFFDCCMNGSGHLTEDFRQPIHLCPVDLHKLQTLVGFDIVTRYQNLTRFYDKHEMADEKEWGARRVNVLKMANLSKS